MPGTGKNSVERQWGQVATSSVHPGEEPPDLLEDLGREKFLGYGFSDGQRSCFPDLGYTRESRECPLLGRHPDLVDMMAVTEHSCLSRPNREYMQEDSQ